VSRGWEEPGEGQEGEAARRPALFPPERVVEALRPKPGQRFLDVGCGAGTFFFPVFEAMGGQGVFLAAEWQEDLLRRFLNRLETQAERPGYTRIEVVRSKPDRLPLPDACADLVLLAQVYHRLADRAAYLLELRRLLAPGGTLCLLDWRPPTEDPEVAAEGEPLGPPHAARVGEGTACRELAAAGFQWMVAHGGFSRNWCLTARI
jgi:ubiquinone/menaquinone biosynthesis C-methylase UbiE